MFLLYRSYGPHTTKFVVYAAIVTAPHEIIDLKHRSPHFRLYPLLLSFWFKVALITVRKQS